MIELYFFIFAVLLVVGGVIGFTKAGSKVSLVAGLVSGLFIALGLYISSFVLIGIVSLLLLGSFTSRFLKTKKFMPSGMLLALSIIAVVLSLLKLLK